MNKEELAIILPHYNYEEFIEETLDSINNQKFKDFHLYIVDDCSTDNSLNIIQNFIAKSKLNATVIKHNKNKFIGAALNTGHLEALKNNHDYYSWITSDNIYFSDCFSTLIENIKSLNLDYIYSSFNYLLNGGIIKDGPNEHYFNYAFSINKWSQGMCFMYKKEVYEKVGSYLEGINHVQDYDYCVRLELNNIKIGYIKDTLGLCRCHNNRRSYIFEEDIKSQRSQLYKKYGI